MRQSKSRNNNQRLLTSLNTHKGILYIVYDYKIENGLNLHYKSANEVLIPSFHSYEQGAEKNIEIGAK